MTEKMNPFEQIVETMKAFTDTDIFYKLRKQSSGSKFVVALITSIVACLFTFIVGGFKLSQNKAWAEIIDALPGFAYSNGEMIFGEKYDHAVGDGESVYVVVDTDVDTWAFPQYDNTVQGTDVTNKVASIVSNPQIEGIIFVSKKNFILLTDIKVNTSYQEMKWSDFLGVFGIQSLSKLQIQSHYKGAIMKFATVLFFFGIPGYILRLFFITLILTLVALIIKAAQKADDDFTTLYWMSFYMQSAFMMIIALFKVCFSGKSTVWTIACFIYYITVMTRVLKNGAPMERAFVGNSGPSPSVGVIHDDFEQFMGESNYVRDVEEKSAFDLYTKPEDNSSPNVGGSPFYTEEETREQTGQTSGLSGLSLKRDD